jgi:hypothetical protein
MRSSAASMDRGTAFFERASSSLGSVSAALATTTTVAETLSK